MDRCTPRWDIRSAEQWLAEAERFEQMAEQLKLNPGLSASFRQMAAEARWRAAHHSNKEPDE